MAAVAIADIATASLIWIITGFDNEFWGIVGIYFCVLGFLRFLIYLRMLSEKEDK